MVLLGKWHSIRCSHEHLSTPRSHPGLEPGSPILVIFLKSLEEAVSKLEYVMHTIC